MYCGWGEPDVAFSKLPRNWGNDFLLLDARSAQADETLGLSRRRFAAGICDVALMGWAV